MNDNKPSILWIIISLVIFTLGAIGFYSNYKKIFADNLESSNTSQVSESIENEKIKELEQKVEVFAEN